MNPEICRQPRRQPKTREKRKAKGSQPNPIREFSRVYTVQYSQVNQIVLGPDGDELAYLFVGFGERSDSFGHDQRHLVGRRGVNSIDKDAPRSILFDRLTPTIWPSEDDRVWF